MPRNISYLTSLERTELAILKENFVNSDLTPRWDKKRKVYTSKKHYSKLYADSGKNNFPSHSTDTLKRDFTHSHEDQNHFPLLVIK